MPLALCRPHPGFFGAVGLFALKISLRGAVRLFALVTPSDYSKWDLCSFYLEYRSWSELLHSE